MDKRIAKELEMDSLAFARRVECLDKLNVAMEDGGVSEICDELEKGGVSYTLNIYSATLSFTFYVKDPLGDEAVLKFRNKLRKAGWKLEREPATYPQEVYIDYKMDGYETTVHIYATSSGVEGAKCQRVQVGTEMKEVPVYEVQCVEE